MEEVEGNQLDEDKVYELLCQAVTDGKTEVNLEESDCYLKPKKTSDNKKLKKKNITSTVWKTLSIIYTERAKENTRQIMKSNFAGCF